MSDPDTMDHPEPNAAAPGAPAPAPAPAIIPHAGLRYGVLRVAMLVSVAGVLYLIGLRDWALLISAFVLSAIASFFVFARQRQAAAHNIEVAVEARNARKSPEGPASAQDPEQAPPAG